MKALKGCAVVAVVGIIAVVMLVTGCASSSELDPWFIQGTFDRVNPIATQVTAYAQAPASDVWFDSYGDASGSGENYVYEIRAYDEAGIERKANLISFGGELDGDAGGFLKLVIKGSYVQRWEYAEADAVPASAARELG